MAYMNMRKLEPDSTPVPNIFIDEYMPYANPAYVTVYIFTYRHSLYNTEDITTGDLASKLNLLESDIINAWKYWEQAGLMKIHENTEEHLDIEFLQIKPKNQTEKKVQALKEETRKISIQSKAEYSVEELNIYMERSEEVRQLFSMAQEHLAKLLTYNDMKIIFGFYDWLGLPYDVIDVLLSYCAENNRKSMKYIETVAIDWSENGILNAEEAKRYLELVNGEYRRVMKAFGHTRREPNKTEIKYMKKWLNELNMNINLVELACSKTVIQTGQPQFKYADKIIQNWYEKGVKTIGDVDELDNAFSNEKNEKNKKEDAPKKATVKNRFVNYQQRKWDFDKLKELEYEYIENDLKGS